MRVQALADSRGIWRERIGQQTRVKIIILGDRHILVIQADPRPDRELMRRILQAIQLYRDRHPRHRRPDRVAVWPRRPAVTEKPSDSNCSGRV